MIRPVRVVRSFWLIFACILLTSLSSSSGIVRNLQLAQGETASSVLNLVDANNQSFDVTAEVVRSVPDTDFVQVIFPLPTSLAAGRCVVMVKAHGQTTNSGSVRVRL